MSVLAFIGLTFAISLAGFLCIVLVPAAQSPETAVGLPFWLVMVWGPSLAAMILSARSGDLANLIARAVRVETVPFEVWLLVLAPLALLLLMQPLAEEEAKPLGAGTLALIVALNLALGPMGEELGWRGVMQQQLSVSLGWLEASFLVGLVWLVWHLPLWTIASPQSEISLHLFAIHCILYAVVIGAAYTLSGGSILPAILLHLTVNLAANLSHYAGFANANAWFKGSTLPYLALAGLSIALVYAKTGQHGFRWLAATLQ